MAPALLRRIHRFAHDERGAVMTEAIIILPVLLWAYVALFVYWDAYRAQNTAVKASYTIADLITREREAVTENYITGMKTVFDYLLTGETMTGIIVSSVMWDQDAGQYMVLWSRARGTTTELPQGPMLANVNRMPKMSDGDTVIVVQTSVGFEPAFNVGVPAFDSREFIVTRPRRAPRIDFDV